MKENSKYPAVILQLWCLGKQKFALGVQLLSWHHFIKKQSKQKIVYPLDYLQEQRSNQNLENI